MSVAVALAWVPFVDPLPVWEAWWLLVVPMAAAVAIVNKAVKCHDPRAIGPAAGVLTLWILGTFLAGALGLQLLLWALL